MGSRRCGGISAQLEAKVQRDLRLRDQTNLQEQPFQVVALITDRSTTTQDREHAEEPQKGAVKVDGLDPSGVIAEAVIDEGDGEHAHQD